MANNRMYLRHQGSGVRVCIAKHFGWQWQTPWHIEDDLDEFFGRIADVATGEDYEKFDLEFDHSPA